MTSETFHQPLISDQPYDMSSISMLRLHFLLQANRKVQKELESKIRGIDQMLSQIAAYRTRLVSRPPSGIRPLLNGEDTTTNPQEADDNIVEDPYKKVVDVIRPIVNRRIPSYRFFPPFFHLKDSKPQPNEHCKKTTVDLYMSDIYLSQKHFYFNWKDIERLCVGVFNLLLSLESHIRKRMLELNYPAVTDENSGNSSYSLKIPLFSHEALLFALEASDNAPKRWNRAEWSVIAANLQTRRWEECKVEFLQHASPLINNEEPMSKTELKRLRDIVIKHDGQKNWALITQESGNRRSIPFIFKTFLKEIDRQQQNPPWTLQERNALMYLFDLLGPQWTEIASYFNGTRTAAECKLKSRQIKPHLQHGAWTSLEDEKLCFAVEVFKKSHPSAKSISWSKISDLVGTRNDLQCRNRYEDYLDPAYDRSPLTKEEQRLLLDLVDEIEKKGTIEGVPASSVCGTSHYKRSGEKQFIPWTFLSQKYFPTRRDCFLKKAHPVLYRQREKEVKRILDHLNKEWEKQQAASTIAATQFSLAKIAEESTVSTEKQSANAQKPRKTRRKTATAASTSSKKSTEETSVKNSDKPSRKRKR